ncbi:NADPH-dependent FMN reductase [Haloglomus halophilum]|uniref:NADPH-dependent FMN reductase n=1 Tax=Haloglomus halophilum TaxID=2962672 RepID=UPI0020CA2345|nr:NADPH-dependent FMN reductase [Haloglomus halophilum]
MRSPSDVRPAADPHIVALCGSLRDASRTRIVLAEALAAARDAGATTELIDLRERDIPALDPDAPTPSDAAALADAVAGADAVLLGTPNYHGSYTGVLKDALDHLGRGEVGGATVGLVEVAAGSHPGPALAHLRGVCRTLNAWTLPLEVAVADSHTVVTEDGIADTDLTERVRRLGAELVRYAGVEHYPELAGPPGATGD